MSDTPATNASFEQSQEPSRTNRAYVDAILAACHLPVMVLDRGCRVRRWNSAAEQLFGWRQEDVLGDAPPWVPDDQRDEHQAFCERVLNGEVVVGAQVRWKRKGGSRLDLRISIGPLQDEAGRVWGIVGIVEPPPTQSGPMEPRLESQKMETLGTLASGVAHDFNNILQAIVGYGELAKDAVPKRSLARPYLDRMLTAAQRGEELASQILAFSRQGETASEPIELRNVVREALGLLRASLPSTITIEEQMDSRVGPVLANTGQIHQVLLNLGGNAAHAMKKNGGVLTVSLQEVDVDSELAMKLGVNSQGRYAKLSVSDTGHGIDVGIIERIYEPFFTTKEAGEGTGLGLSIVRDIILGHGGALHVRSEPGVGTTFELYFPETTAARTCPAEAASPACRGTERIIFVDDEESIAAMGKRMLERRGYSVSATTDSREALRRLQLQPDDFDAVVTDQIMPQLTGLALAKELRRLRSDLPIILISGFSPQFAEEIEASNDISAVVRKPFRSDELACVIREALDAASTH